MVVDDDVVFDLLVQRCELDAGLRANRRTGRTARASGCICHGVAGNAELFLEVYLTTRDESQLAFPRAWAKDLIDENGVKTAVGRGKYGPGYMTGLAGIGRFFLRLADPKQTPMAFMVWED